MKLTVLSLNFPPEMGATAVRLFELTKRLAARGHEVQVITAMPNYPTGRVFDGYRGKLRVTEEVGGVRVVRTWIRPSNSLKALPRAASYLSFAMSSLLLGTWRLGRRDLVVFDSPPLPLVPVGLAIGCITRAKVVMNVADIWPDIAVRLGYPMHPLSLRMLRLLERWGYRRSKVVSVTNPKAGKQIQERFPEVEVAVIGNGTDMQRFRPARRSAQTRLKLGAGPDDFLAGYCGLHGLFQGLEVVVEAAAKLRHHPRIKFAMVGDGPTKEALVQLVRRHQLSNIMFCDPVSAEEMPTILASCDAGLVPLATELPGTMPSKVYDTLASGVPIVVSKGCEAATLASEFDVGRTFCPLDVDALAAVLVDLADESPDNRLQMCQRCLELASRFDRESITVRAEQILSAVAEGQPLPRVS